MPLPGEQVWKRRARDALERDGNSLEGALVSRSRRGLARGTVQPRARRNPARGGIQPPSEAEPHPRGRPALERGKVVPVRCRTLRAKRSSARGWLGRLSGGLWVCFTSVCVCFLLCKRVFPSCLGDPHGCPRHTSSWPRAALRAPLA
jgi:hypothetical protein